MLRRLFAALVFSVGAGNASADQSPAREWVTSTSGHTANWVHAGVMELPSKSIFIGDPSWGDDYHLRGSSQVPAAALDIWMLVDPADNSVRVVWLEAAGGLPDHSATNIEFGMDSAYFAFGDLAAGQDLVRIGDLNISGVNDSFEFFLPHIQKQDFNWLALEVPPDQRFVYAVNTRRDGGLKAVWVNDAHNQFSGIMIDIAGRASDKTFIDTFLPAGN